MVSNDSKKGLDKLIFEWIDQIMNTEIPQNIVDLNFNLYDDSNFN